ncbi:MAG: DNA translocase FtsK 4TM domain-containing protein, partial [Verrucomicrobiota bacterium]
MANRSRNHRAANFSIGLVLVCLGAYLFISLVTYSPGDIPLKWAGLIYTKESATSVTHNMGGLFGALLAGYVLFLFGAAGYLLAVGLVGYGLGKWFVPQYSLKDKAGWGALMVLLAACLFQIQPWVIKSWPKDIGGPGGWIGFHLGEKAILKPFGPAAAVFLVLVYLMSLVFAISSHPVRDIRFAWKSLMAWLEARKLERLQRLDDERRVEEERKRIEKRTQKLEKKLRKQAPVAGPEPVPALPEIEPEIIDATAPTPQSKKPKLADLRSGKDEGFKPGLADVHLENYTLPGLDLLDIHDESERTPLDRDELLMIQGLIIETLAQFGIKATPGTITKGPTITRYEVYPDIGVRVDKIVSLERDIARATCAERINILAPIPGKDTVGIEIANSKKVKVTLRELFEKDAWRDTTSRLPLALGMDVYGHTIIGDLAKMPHCLVAGTTGSGKSVCINSIIASLLFRYSPEQLRFIMIDPKVVEMQIYNKLPHLITPVVTDPKKVLLALRWLVDEMELRYRIFAKCGVKNITTFNDRPLPKSQAELDEEKASAEPEPPADPEGGEQEPPDEEMPPIRVPRSDDIIVPDRMPFIVVIIDELADLMQTAPAARA